MKRTAVPMLAGILLLAAVLAVVWSEGGRGPSPAIFPGALARFVPTPLPAPKKPMELSGPDARVGSDFIWARWHPGPGQLHEVNVREGLTLRSEEMAALRHLGLTGTIDVWMSVVRGEAGTRRTVVVLPGWLDKPVDLPLPRSGTLIHVFDGTNWLRIPKDAPLAQKTITLTPKGTNEVDYYMEFPHQGAGGAAYVWDWPH
jgi:hypothetical protein